MTNSIKILSKDKNLILQGDVKKIISSRSAMMYLRNNFCYDIVDGEIIISDVDSINEVLDDIKVIAEYAGCDIIFDNDVSEEIKSYENEELLFQEFSEKAKQIRDEHPDADEFRKFEENLKSSLPARTLYPLQLLSAYHMAFSQNSCNFSVPGAGKTSIVYGAYAYLHSLPENDPKHVDCIFLIGPLSSFGPWELEYEECFGTKPSVKRLVGAISKEEKELYLSMMNTCEITLSSYQSIPSIKDGIKTFLQNHRTMLVLDEAHKVKNFKGAIIASSVLELAQFAKSRIILTGTPAPQGYADLHNLYKFIWPNKDIIGFSISQLLNMSSTPRDYRVRTLLDRISPFFIRIKKSDLNIPSAIHHIVPVEMSSSQRDIYDVIEGRFMNSLTEYEYESNVPEEVARAKMVRLMQVATNPSLLRDALSSYFDDDGNTINESEADKDFLYQVQKFWKDEVPPKFLVAKDLVKKIISEGGKVIIWATYIKNVIMLKSYLEEDGIAVRTLYGETPVACDDESSDIETREKIVAEFNKPISSFNVIIANPFAVAESISLHKQCHNAIYLERNFNAANFIQSKDRIHRYGLKNDVVTNYYYLVSSNSIDESINRRLKEKEERLLEIIESMPIPLFANITENEGYEDIKAVIKDYVTRAKKI